MQTGRPLFSRLFAISAPAFLLAVAACSSGGDNAALEDSPSPTTVATATASSTPPPPDPMAAQRVFEEFVAAVQAEDLNGAWALYTASIEGAAEEHNDSLGCSYQAFVVEFPRIGNLFSRETPFEVLEHFGGGSPTSPVEIKLSGATGDAYLVTMLRVEANEPYRLRFFNNGKVSSVAGAPDPLPSPGDPQGFCNIWNGPR